MGGKFFFIDQDVFFLFRIIIYHFPRYIDDIFFTSNQSVDAINQMLDEANQFHPNIKLVRQIGTSVSFLDILVENKNGVLATSVYHKEAAEPYVVPKGEKADPGSLDPNGSWWILWILVDPDGS